MLYCTHCGAELAPDTQFCYACGKKLIIPPQKKDNSSSSAAQGVSRQQDTDENELTLTEKSLINTVYRKIKLEYITWLIVFGIQAIVAFYCFLIEYYYGGVAFALMAVWNLIGAIKIKNFSKGLLNYPVGISAHYNSPVLLIVFLFLNVALGWGTGIIGSIFGLLTYGFVNSNRQAFLTIEQKTLQKSSSFTFYGQPVGTSDQSATKSASSQRPPEATTWICNSCGRTNYSYVGTCACGQIKIKNKQSISLNN